MCEAVNAAILHAFNMLWEDTILQTALDAFLAFVGGWACSVCVPADDVCNAVDRQVYTCIDMHKFQTV